MKPDAVIEVETTVEFIPNKKYRASVWRTEGQHQTGFYMVDTWQEESSFGEPVENTLQCSIVNNYNEDVIAVMQRANTPFAGVLYFTTSEYNGKVYNEIILSSKALQ